MPSPPPAVVIVVRHGARLDAADKQWHLTSPTPYDPPLTYGGWTQSRALGARIADLLQAREESGEEGKADSPSERTRQLQGFVDNYVDGNHHQQQQKHKGRKRKHKVFIHSSPFLRCIQTSVAIGAGMAEYSGQMQHRPHISQLRSRTNRTSSIDSPRLAPIPEPGEGHPDTSWKPSAPNSRKATVRIDAFLGEWLSPDYFDQIMPPPNSVMMVAGAKADLLRRAEPIPGNNSPSLASPGNFPGGWSADLAARPAAGDDSGLDSLSTLEGSQPSPRRRDRASSQSSAGSGSNKSSSSTKISTNLTPDIGGYTPPKPTWAISPSDPIPPGYVAHARDACVNVDYQWDSMRPPQDWGNGGEYGEEWGSMHKRFRKGLHHMINWYKNQPQETPEDSEEVVDTVLIIVTHGAGCNALIGALKNQPVLMDVGMASLTMAVRKDIIYGRSALPDVEEVSVNPSFRSSSGRGGGQVEVSECYDVKLEASTEHLRAGANPLAVPQLQPPRLSIPRSRHENQFTGDNRPMLADFGRAATIATGALRRGSLASALQPRSTVQSPSARGLTGLWAAPSTTSTDVDEPSPGDDMVLNFGHSDNDPAPVERAKQADERARAAEKAGTESPNNRGSPSPGPGLGRTNSQRGLWGDAAALHPAIERERGGTPKRRWTVTEKHM